jgi:peptidoglycan/xylan/chitin deacetylase (PgdA/CDA1 family)
LLREHVAAHDSTNVVVSGPILVSEESLPSVATSWLRYETERKITRLSRKSELSWVNDVGMAANCSAQRIRLLSAGGFDERFVGACEEFEFGYRLMKGGTRFHFLSSAVTTQVYRKTATDIVKDARRRGMNEVILCRKHPDFRPISSLARLNEGTSAMRLARKAALRPPLFVEPLLRFPFWIATPLSWSRHVGRVGIRVLGFRMGVALFRSAMREVGSWRQFRQEFGLRTPILTYHHVGLARAGTNRLMTVAPEGFERQMGWLARHGYVSVSPSDWLAWREQGKPLPQKPVMITFDDGYADTARYALPIIKKYGFKATVYVVTGQMGGIDLWDTNGGWATVNHHLMTAEQIKSWHAQGVEFGVHTRTHPDLRTLDPAALEAEVTGSADELEKLLGVRPMSFAYPYGDYDARVREHVCRVFALALTCDEGLNYLSTNPALLRRVMVLPNDSMVEFALRVRLGWSPLERVRQMTRHRLGRTALRRALARWSWPQQTIAR